MKSVSVFSSRSTIAACTSVVQCFSRIVKLQRNWDRENGLFFVGKTKRDPSDDSERQLALDVISLKHLQHLKR